MWNTRSSDWRMRSAKLRKRQGEVGMLAQQRLELVGGEVAHFGRLERFDGRAYPVPGEDGRLAEGVARAENGVGQRAAVGRDGVDLHQALLHDPPAARLAP